MEHEKSTCMLYAVSVHGPEWSALLATLFCLRCADVSICRSPGAGLEGCLPTGTSSLSQALRLVRKMGI